MMSVGRTVMAVASWRILAVAAAACPPGTTLVDSFQTPDKHKWRACEDLQTRGGGIFLVDETKDAVVHFAKGYEPYSPKPDSEYYLGLDKHTACYGAIDLLGDALLKNGEPTWATVESAVPVIRKSGGGSGYPRCSGVRTFVGSRSASVDAAFTDHAEDCDANGWPPVQSYVMNLTAKARGEPLIMDFAKYLNFSAMAEGLVGGHLPNVVFFFTVAPDSPYKPKAAQNATDHYWTMLATPVPDMEGGREQSTWFRFQQTVCHAAPAAGASDSTDASCDLHGAPIYFDSFWFSNSPIGAPWVPKQYMANASGFYSNLLAVKTYWEAELGKEGMMELQLPESAATNGTWLRTQAVHAFVRSMITREDTWHPRYGILPGYGISLQDGFQDTFTSTAAAAIEWGAWAYAKGVIDNWLRYYVRTNGGITYRAEETPLSARMLTLFAQYVSMTGDGALLLTHFPKAKALGEWLLNRHQLSLAYPLDDPRHGIPAGNDEGDTFIGTEYDDGSHFLHYYASAAEAHRGFLEMGRVWVALGTQAGRPEVVSHGKALLAVAPRLLHDLQRSLNATTTPTGNPYAPRCLPTVADMRTDAATGLCDQSCSFRSYAEMMYAGVLTTQQVDDIYTFGRNGSSGNYRFVTLGSPGYNHKQTTYTPYGWAYGLLQHDFIERYLLHWFAMSAHTYTRGTWTTPEATHPDRDVASTAYVAAGLLTAPLYLKWALVFEDVTDRTVWLGKALPRDWLRAGATPVVARGVPTRYGRVSLSVAAEVTAEQAPTATPTYRVRANVSLPHTYVGATGPPGGLRLRLRAPAPHAGKLASVTVGGKAWTAFDASSETITFEAGSLTAARLAQLQAVVAEWRA